MTPFHLETATIQKQMRWRRRARLSVIAALVFMALRPAQADDKLPENMLGTWCEPSQINTASSRIYFRPSRVGREHCNDFSDGITVFPEGFHDDAPLDDAPECHFDKIEQIDGDAYRVRMRCTKSEQGNTYPSIVKFEIVRELLFVTGIPEP